MNASHPSPSWWRHGHVWLLIAAPAAAALGGAVTIAIALARPDPVVAPATHGKALQPAQQARNHAATSTRN